MSKQFFVLTCLSLLLMLSGCGQDPEEDILSAEGNTGNKLQEDALSVEEDTGKKPEDVLPVETDTSEQLEKTYNEENLVVYQEGKVGQTAPIAAGKDITAYIDVDNCLWVSGENGFYLPENQSRDVKSVSFYNTRILSRVVLQTDDSLRISGQILEDVAVVTLGKGNHAAAIKNDGTLWMWGDNNFGQLGTNDYEARTAPVKILDSVTSVACGSDFTAVIKEDGSLWMWGSNFNNQIGAEAEDRQLTPIQILDNVTAVSCGPCYTAAIKTDGSLWTWGGDLWSEVPTQIMEDVAALSCGDDFVAAIKRDGSLWTLGGNDYGQLGDGGQYYGIKYEPERIMEDVMAVSCGPNHAVAVQTDGSIWTWGSNGGYQIGYGVGGNSTYSSGNSRTPVQTSPYKIANLSNSPTESSNGSEWYSDIVNWATEEGIMTGVSATFSPEKPCTQGDMLVLLWNLAGRPYNGENELSNEDSYLKAALNWTIYWGYVDRSATIPCTRMQAVLYMWYAAGEPTGGINRFEDIRTGSQSVAWAVENGIASGTSETTFSPTDAITCAQALEFLYNSHKAGIDFSAAQEQFNYG